MCQVLVQGPLLRTSSTLGLLWPVEHLETWPSLAAAVVEGGWWASRLGSKRQGSTLRGPVPDSRGESRVTNGFPGSQARDRARSGRQPA